MDQIAKFSSEKLFFESNPKQFGQIQNHSWPLEGQSNSCVMYLLFLILICSTLIKLDFDQCCQSYKALHLVFVGMCFVEYSKISYVYKSKCKPNMTFDQTILLIFSQIWIETNLKLSKKATDCAKMFILHTISNVSYLSKHYTWG